MAHLLLVERDPERAAAFRAVLEAAGHRITALRLASEVLPFLRAEGHRFDGVVLGTLQWGETTSFEVVKELCRIPAFEDLGKILVFPIMADPREAAQMYGDRGYASFEPQVPRTLAVNEANLLALNDAVAVLLRKTGEE